MQQHEEEKNILTQFDKQFPDIENKGYDNRSLKKKWNRKSLRNQTGLKNDSGILEAHESPNQTGVWLPRSKGSFTPAIFAVIASTI